MKKVLALLVVCFMALGARLAMADTRTDSLGLTAGQQVDDLDSIWLFPQDAANFGNVADFRLGYLGDGGDYANPWFGIIHKDWDGLGYIGIYTGRPFNNANDGIEPNVNPANQNGILTGNFSWYQLTSPYYSSFVAGWTNYNGARIGDTDDEIEAHYHNIRLGVEDATVADPQNKADIFWAKDFTDVTLGLHVNYASQDGDNGEYAYENYSESSNSPLGSGDESGFYTITSVNPAAGDTTKTTDNMFSQVLGVDLGLTLKNLGPDQSLALGLGYSIGSLDVEWNEYEENAAATGTNPEYLESLKDNGISEFRANALLKSKVNDTTTGRIYANVRLGQFGDKESYQYDRDNNGNYDTDEGDTYLATNTYSDSNINLGIACDHNVADGKAHVIAGIEAIYDGRAWNQTALENLAGSTDVNQVQDGSGEKYTEDWWVVPVNVAVEAPLFSWLKFRVGAQNNLFQNISAKVVHLDTPNAAGTAFQNTTTATQSMDYVNYLDMSYGASASFENFTLDLQIERGSLYDALSSLQPGNGALFSNTDYLVYFEQADIRYAF
jgi:hypothetical protein